MRDFKFMHEHHGYIYHDGSMLTTKGEVIPREEMKRIIKLHRSINRMYKPMALLWYTDCMNGKSINWQN